MTREDRVVKQVECALNPEGHTRGLLYKNGMAVVGCTRCLERLELREYYDRLNAVQIGGFRVSIQVGESMYCQPRDNNGVYSSVEMGYPSHDITKIVPELLEHCEDKDQPCDTVYPYTPVELVVKLLQRVREMGL